MAKLNTTTIQDVTNKMSVGVVSTTNDKNYFEELYAWSPQLDKSDIFAEVVPLATNVPSADANVIANPTIISKLTDYQLDSLPASNGQGYSCFATPGNTSSTRLKHFLTPQKYGNGYAFILKDSVGTVIPLTSGSYQFDYHNGILRFNEGNTPVDMGLSTPLTITVYRYIGDMLIDEAAGANANDSWRQPARLLDDTSTLLTGWTADPTIDGVVVADGDIVLFTSLVAPLDNNRKYVWDNTLLTWTLVLDGQNSDGSPTDGDKLIIKEGTSYSDRGFVFNGTVWIETSSFNLTVQEADGLPLGTNINNLVLCDTTTNNIYIDGTTAYLHAPLAPLPIEIDNNIVEWTGRLSQSNINYNGTEPAGTDVNYIARLSDINAVNTFFSTVESFSNGSSGLLTLTINGTIVATIDLSSNFNETNRITGQIITDYDITGAGDAIVDGVVTFANGTFAVVSIASIGPIYADPYQKGTCSININNMAAFRQGYNEVILTRGADVSSTYQFFYDNDAGADPVITSSDLSEDTPVLKYLSGVPFYDTGSTFDYDVVIANAFNNVYHSSNAPVTVDGFPGVLLAPIEYTNAAVTGVSTPPDIAETMTVTDYNFTVIAGVEDNDVQIDAIPRDPYADYITDTSASKGITINSIVASSTVVLENFIDENYRFPRTTNFNVVPGSLTGNWTSATSLTSLTNELQVYDEDAVTKQCLAHPSVDYSTARLPIGPDYTTLSGGTSHQYIRAFQGTIDESNGIIDIPGLTDAHIANDNFILEVKVPTKTDWMVINKDYVMNSFEDNVKYVNTTWVLNNVQALDDWVIPTASNGYKYKCTVAGTTGATEPAAWPTVVGTTVVDGTTTWTCYQIDNQEGCRINPTVHSPNLDNSIQFTLGTYAADLSVNRMIFVRITIASNTYSGILTSGYGISDW